MTTEKIMKYSLAVLGAALMLASTPSRASQETPGLIYGMPFEDGKVFFYTTGNKSGVTGCGTGVPDRWVFDASTGKGQAMLSGILTFCALEQPIAVTGTGTGQCIDWPDTESVRYIIRQP